MVHPDTVMNAECGVRNAELQELTKRFALEVIALSEEVMMSRVAEVIMRQLIRSATSVGANYRAACRAKSRADFIAKMGIVEEEADESRYWIELLLESDRIAQSRAEQFFEQCDAILAMTVASIRTARGQR